MIDSIYLYESIIFTAFSLFLIIINLIRIDISTLYKIRVCGVIGACFICLSAIDGNAVLFEPMFLPKYFRVAAAFFNLSELMMYVYYQLGLTYKSARTNVPTCLLFVMIASMLITLALYIIGNVLQDITGLYFPNAIGNLGTSFASIIIGILITYGYVKLYLFVKLTSTQKNTSNINSSVSNTSNNNSSFKASVKVSSGRTSINIALKSLFRIMLILLIVTISSAGFQLYRGYLIFIDKESKQFVGNPNKYDGSSNAALVVILGAINIVLGFALMPKKNTIITEQPKIATTSFQTQNTVSGDNHILKGYRPYLNSMPVSV
jgi:hypothetical protein